MCSFWPSTWMDTNTLSREYSSFKKRINRQRSKLNGPTDEMEVGGFAIKRDPFAKIYVVRTKKSSNNSKRPRLENGDDDLPPEKVIALDD